jgi:enoyl-CoA hydratase/carnithine racemase
VNVTRRETTALVTLDWPDRRNALGPQEGIEVGAVLREVAAAGDVRAVVLTGSGAFCAGGDLAAIADLVAHGGREAVHAALYEIFHGVVRALVEMPAPTLAAIDGPAIGLGMDLALACDWRAVGPEGWLRQGWAELGLIPGLGGELLLRRLAPGLIWSLLGSSERLGPARAAALGLAEPADGTALDAALRRADALARVPLDALRGYVRLHRQELRARLDAHLAACLEIQVGLLCSDEFQRRAARALGRP